MAKKKLKWLCYFAVSDSLYVQDSAGTKTSKPGEPLVLQSPGFKGTKDLQNKSLKGVNHYRYIVKVQIIVIFNEM